jgi:hypothetical protein
MMTKTIVMLVKVLPLLLLVAATPTEELRTGDRLFADVPIIAHGAAHVGEASFREIALTVGERTSYAVQILVRDPATGFVWTLTERSDKPLKVAAVRTAVMAASRFAVADQKLIVFQVHGPDLLLFTSRRVSRSFARAIAETELDIRRELASTWPITGALPKETALRSVALNTVLPWQFLVDSQFGPTAYRVDVDALSFAHQRWDLALRNEKGVVEHLYISPSLRPLQKK